MNRAELFGRLSELAVGVGANVQPDQLVTVGAHLGQEEMARAVAGAAYRQGARFVDVSYFDPYVKRARIEHAREETLDFVPSWYGERMLELGRQRTAAVSLAGPPPRALEGVDPVRAGRDQLPFIRESMVVLNERTRNWTIIPCPTSLWASLVYPELEAEQAFERLCEDIAFICRLDQPDPAAAWRARVAELTLAANHLSGLQLDSVHFEGPGTDLTIGLLPSSRWLAAEFETVDGIPHIPNLPTEEVATTPDPERTDGTVRSTRPLTLFDGTLVSGLELRFERGRAVEITAEEGAEVLRGRAGGDDGGGRLGEVALVDRESRIGSLDRIFYDTLIDENAVSHIALGAGFDFAVDEADLPRVNRSLIHIDFMIGGDDVAVTGLTRDGSRVPLLRGGAWQLFEGATPVS